MTPLQLYLAFLLLARTKPRFSPRQFCIMLYLILNEERRELCRMARDLQVSKAATSRALDNLVVDGHVERIVKADDKRRRYVTITEAGRSFIAKLCVAT